MASKYFHDLKSRDVQRYSMNDIGIQRGIPISSLAANPYPH